MRRRIKEMLIAVSVCMMLAVSPIVMDTINGGGSVSASTNGTADALVEHAISHKGCKYNNFKDAKAFTTDWCAAFVQHCSAKTGAGKSIPTGGYNYVNDLSYNIVNSKGGKITFVNNAFYNSKKACFSAKSRNEKRVVKNLSYKPRKGDLIIFSSDGSYWWTHVGIVRANASSPTKNVPTIEGNTGTSNFKTSKVMQKSRTSVGGFRIVAYVTPKYKSVAPATYTHTITFNTNGGSGSFGTIKVQDGKGFSIPTAKPTKAGYTFTGWYARRLADNKYHTNQKGWVTWNDITKYKYTPSMYKPGVKHNMDNSWMKGSTKSNYTFYAQWTPNKYTVKYNADKGTGTMNQVTVDASGKSSSFGAVNKFERAGYTFDGWHIQKLVGGKVYWIVPNGNSWKWKENAKIEERKYYRNVSAISFGRGGVENGATIVMWATWKEAPVYVPEVEEESTEMIEDIDQGSEYDDDPFVDIDEEQDMEEDLDECMEDDCDDEEDEITDAEEQNDEQEYIEEEVAEPVYAWTAWSEFSTTRPTAQDNRKIESRIEYRYRDKQFVTSGRDSLSGYTKESTKTDSPVYGAWSTSSKSGSTTVTDAKKSVVTVESKTVQKSLAHYCKCKKVCWRNSEGSCKYCGGKTNYGVISIYSSKSLASSGYKKDTDGSYFLPTTVKVNSPDKLGTIYYMTWQGKSVNSFTTGSTVGGKNTFVWPSGTATVTRTKTVNSVNTFSKWGNWSNWSTSQYSGNSNRQVEIRTVYRYKDYVQQ